MSTDQSKLETMRHSAAHLLAASVLELYPDTKLGVGPVIEHGFYYDFLFSNPIGEDDLKKIEEKMREIQGRGEAFRREEMSIDEAINFFEERGQIFKVELLRDLKEKGTTAMKSNETQEVDASKSAVASIYWTGNFVDLCRGPHVDSTREIGPFRLLKLAGAYWRGNEKNPQLARVYGLAYETESELTNYLKILEEAEKRDHRKLGAELDLFTFSPFVGPGLPLWTPRGTLLCNLLDDFVWQLRRERGYEQVTIPHITKKELYEISGHWQKFKDELFKIVTREGHEFAVKPMNCPHHTQIYAHLQRSYKDLPQRYAETTMCYRDEQTGELHGLSRVRSFTQDDAHVFCRENQVKEEFLKIWDIIDIFYPAVGFNELQVRVSLHDPKNFQKYLGTPEIWERAENQLRELAKDRGVNYIEAVEEAAFYGPKIDFMAKDSIGRDWQVATIQLDINLPERFDLFCVNETGEHERIVMIHAAIMGSIERFLSILIEHHAGAFPVWLSVTQVLFVPVGSGHIEPARGLEKHLRELGIRAEVDDANETVGNKIRKAEKQKVPYMIVVGDKEIEGLSPETFDQKEFVLRVRGVKDMVNMTGKEFKEKILDEIKNKK